MDLSRNIRTYYDLAKPRMVYANALVAAAGFAYASAGPIDWVLFAVTVLGLMAVIASGCVFNNYHDRHMDAKMERTRGRAFPMGQASPFWALVYGTTLLGAGMALLSYTNLVAMLAAGAGFIAYVLLYTPMKPRTPHALFVGAIAGATPPVVGYTAVTQSFDIAAGILFLLLFVWQIPHFLAIAVYRGEEYGAAGVPLFMRGPYDARHKKIARRVFHASLLILLAFCIALFVL